MGLERDGADSDDELFGTSAHIRAGTGLDDKGPEEVDSADEFENIGDFLSANAEGEGVVRARAKDSDASDDSEDEEDEEDDYDPVEYSKVQVKQPKAPMSAKTAGVKEAAIKKAVMAASKAAQPVTAAKNSGLVASADRRAPPRPTKRKGPDEDSNAAGAAKVMPPAKKIKSGLTGQQKSEIKGAVFKYLGRKPMTMSELTKKLKVVLKGPKDDPRTTKEKDLALEYCKEVLRDCTRKIVIETVEHRELKPELK